MLLSGTVISTNVSKAKGIPKRPVEELEFNEQGIVGDVHSGTWHRQISLLSKESIDAFTERTGRAVKFGEFAENLTVSGLDLSKVAILDKFKINDAILEVTQIGKKCHGDACAIFREVGQCMMPKEGLFARVLAKGKAKAGDELEYWPRILKISIITMSDRASAKVYEDKSGKAAKEALEQFFANTNWHWQVDSVLLPDDAILLQQQVQQALDKQVDIIFTLGGTGVGRRDITPETVAKFCDRFIPGIMENIRAKYGAQNPAALLSRSIAGISQKTQIYTLPGSVKAVNEYLTEITKTLEHVIYMLYGIDMHGHKEDNPSLK